MADGGVMAHIFPFLSWIAAGASLVLLIVFGMRSEVRVQSLVALGLAYLVALYAQIIVRSNLVNVVGLVLQTALAIYLIVRIKIGR